MVPNIDSMIYDICILGFFYKIVIDELCILSYYNRIYIII